MLVDDEELARESTKALLENQGYKVTTFADPIDAIEHYKSFFENFDFVMLDMIMPIMNGEELFNELKTINPDIKAILATGYSYDSEEKLVNQGIISRLHKPYTIEQLENKLTQIL